MGRIRLCKSCGQPIKFVKTTLGKAMPVNVDPIEYRPDENGPITIVTAAGRVIRGKEDHTANLFGYMSHFATCPDADKFRRKA